MYILGVLESTSGNLRRGLNRRVETEMAFVRLCSPNLDSSVDALLKRVAAIESAVRSGVAAKPAVQNTDAPTEQRAEPAAHEMLPDGEVGCWADVLEELKSINRPLAGILGNSSACVQGNHMVIASDNDSLMSILKTNNNSVDLRRAIFNITGIKYKIGVNKISGQSVQAPPPPEEFAPPADPLASFIAQAEGYGIKITK